MHSIPSAHTSTPSTQKLRGAASIRRVLSVCAGLSKGTLKFVTISRRTSHRCYRALTEQGILDHIEKHHKGETYDSIAIPQTRPQVQRPRRTRTASQGVTPPQGTPGSSTGTTPSSSSINIATTSSSAAIISPPYYFGTGHPDSTPSSEQQHFPAIQPSLQLDSPFPLNPPASGQASQPWFSLSDWQRTLAFTQPAVDQTLNTSSMPQSQYPVGTRSSSSTPAPFQATSFTNVEMGEGHNGQIPIPRWFQGVQSNGAHSPGHGFDPSQHRAALNLPSTSSTSVPPASFPPTSAHEHPLMYPGQGFLPSPFQFPVDPSPTSTPFMGLTPDMPNTTTNAFEPPTGRVIHVSQLPAAPAPTSNRGRRYMDVPLPSLPSASTTRASGLFSESLGLDFNASQPLEPLPFPDFSSPADGTYPYWGDNWDLAVDQNSLMALLFPAQGTGESADPDRPDVGF